MQAAQQREREFTIPHNPEFERLVLGVVMLQPESEQSAFFSEVETQLTPADFFLSSNRIIFESFSALSRRGVLISPLTLADELRQRGGDPLLNRVGGQAYIGSLIDGCPRFSNLDTPIKRLKDLSAKRWVMRLGQRLIQCAEDDERPAVEIFEAAEKAIAEAHVGQVEDDLIISQTAADDTLNELCRRWNPRMDLPGVKSGYSSLDRMLHGLRPGRLHLLAARPGEGKTCLALNIAHNATRMRQQEQPIILLVSLEMPVRQLMERAFATMARIDQDKMLSGDLNKEEKESIFNAARELGLQQVHFLEPRNQLAVDAIKSRIARLQRRCGRVDLVVVDYIQLLSSSRPGDREYERISDVSRSLKLLALNHDVPVLALCQLNREIEKRHSQSKPQLSDLRGSGSLEQDADVVMFLHNPNDNPDSAERQLLVEKQRGGRTGIVNLLWYKEQSRFVSAFRGGE